MREMMGYYEGAVWNGHGDYYHGRNNNGRTGICTYSDVKGTLDEKIVMWFIADGAENELTAAELT